MAEKIAYLDYSNIYAGAERVLATIIGGLDRHNYEPILIMPYPMEHQRKYNDLDCKKIYLASGLKWWMGSSRWRHPLRGTDFLYRSIMGNRLVHVLKREKIKLLHVNLLRPDSLMWIQAAKQADIKIIGHFRSHSVDWVAPARTQECCDIIICVSDFAQSKIIEKGRYAPTKVIYDSVDIDFFSNNISRKEAKKTLGFPEDCILISSIGQLSLRKGHDNAIKAFANIANTFPKAILYIAGGGEQDELLYLKNLASSLSKSVQGRIRFSEYQISDIRTVYSASDLVLTLSKDGEAFGLVPYESALMDVPFIAPEIGAVKEFVENGKNGLLIDSNNIEHIIDKIEWALNNSEACHKMVQNLKMTVQNNLNPNVMCRNLEKIYQDLINE